VNVDGAPYVSVKARVEELGRIFQGSALKEGFTIDLYDSPVQMPPSWDPYRDSHPVPLFHNISVGLPDEGAHPC
jgi:hypothetical protein